MEEDGRARLQPPSRVSWRRGEKWSRRACAPFRVWLISDTLQMQICLFFFSFKSPFTFDFFQAQHCWERLDCARPWRFQCNGQSKITVKTQMTKSLIKKKKQCPVYFLHVPLLISDLVDYFVARFCRCMFENKQAPFWLSL